MFVPLLLATCSRRAAGVVLAVVSLVTAVGGCALGGTAETKPTTGTSSVSAAATPDTASASNRLVLRFEGHVATVILDDTPVAREFATMLPMTLHLSDPMGQAKSGPLPLSWSPDVTHAARTFRTTVGELVYWSPSSTVAVVYDDLGQRVPPPGLVRLGVIDTGLDEVAAGGNALTMRIDLAPDAGS
jgi:hypothetical protein